MEGTFQSLRNLNLCKKSIVKIKFAYKQSSSISNLSYPPLLVRKQKFCRPCAKLYIVNHTTHIMR